MSQHPTNETLAEFAWDALEGAEADAVETHVAACGDCALLVERVRAEARRLSAALDVPVPAGLAARILDAATPAAASPTAREGGFRPAAWIGLAAAALFAVTSAWAWRGMESANRRIDKLEKELAARPKVVQGTVADLDEEIRKAMEAYGRTQAEIDLGTVLAGVEFTEPQYGDAARQLLLAKSDATSELLYRAARGEIDYGELASMDSYAGVDLELRDKLDATSLANVLAALDRASRVDSTAVASALSSELQSVASLDQAQKSSLQSLLLEKLGWRRDFHFLPLTVQREIAARVIGAGGKLGPEAGALLNNQQKSRVLSYLASAETERNRYWDNLKKNANKH